MPGFPIRTPWDHSWVDSSPRPIAASHVLHRLLVPRHPPSALDNLTTENKMLASTVQFSTNDQPTTPTPTPAPTPNRATTAAQPTMERYADQVVPGTETTTPPRTIRPGGAPPPHGGRARLFFQDPTGCPSPATSRTSRSFRTRERTTPKTGRCRVVLDQPAVAGS